jgi:hypothetical protein
MTDEQINDIIATSLGFIEEEPWLDGRRCWVHIDKPNVGHDSIPDFCNDLNAMHEAMLLHPRKNLLRKFLYLEVLEDPTNTANEPAWATAKQWAKAYITSLG